MSDEGYKSLDEALEALEPRRRRALKTPLLFWQYARLPAMGACAVVLGVLVYQGLKLLGLPHWLFEILNPVLSMGAIICGIVFGMATTQKREHESIVKIYEESGYDLPPPPDDAEPPKSTPFFS